MAFVSAGVLGWDVAANRVPATLRSPRRGAVQLTMTAAGSARMGELSGTLGGKNATWSRRQFDKWVEMRMGKDPAHPAYWYAVGDVFAAPDGERILRIEGVDVAKSEMLSETRFRSYSRKIFVFRDVETGEVVTSYKGTPMKPLAYTYQMMTYSLSDDGALVAQTTMGTGDNVVTLQGDRFYWRELGNSLVISSPLFTKRGWNENYDFFILPADSGVSNPYQLSWVGFGPMSYIPSGSGMIEMAGARFDAFEALPESIREYVRDKAPLWKSPPSGEEEIARLQAGEATQSF